MIWILLIIFIKIYLILKLKNLQYNIEATRNVTISKLLYSEIIFQTYRYFSFLHHAQMT